MKLGSVKFIVKRNTLFVVCFLSFICLSFNSKAQQLEKKAKTTSDNIKKTVIQKPQKFIQRFLGNQVAEPKHYLGIEIGALTNGWKVGILSGINNKKNERIIGISLQEWKHDKEEKMKSSMTRIEGQGKQLPYIFGKINSFYALNFIYGKNKLLLKGLFSPNSDLHLVLSGGLSLGLKKPYYLKLNSSDISSEFNIIEAPYSTENEKYFLNQSKIYSRTPFFKNLDNIRIIPGLFISPSIQINFGNRLFVKRLIIGSNISIYANRVVIIADGRGKNLNSNFYVAFLIGKGY